MSKPPILIMSNHIDGIGGVERVVQMVANGLTERGYDVALYGLTPVEGPSLPLDGVKCEHGFMSERTNVSTTRRRFVPELLDRNYQRLSEQRKAVRSEVVENLSTTLERFRDGVFICSQLFVMEHVHELGIEDVMRSGVRLIGQYHNSFDMAMAGSEYRRAWRVYRDLDRFLLLTKRDQELFRKRGFNNTETMANPLSFYPESVPEDREKLVVALARYDNQKSLDHALRAWAQIAPRHPGWRFELYGTGPLEGQLQELIASLGIDNSARLMGSTSEPQAVLNRAAVHVLSSQHEGLPMVLGEAMACGVPSVAYNCAPGISEMVTHESDGIIVPRGAIGSLAEGLSRLMGDEALRRSMSRAGRESARRQDSGKILDQWEDLIEGTMR